MSQERSGVVKNTYLEDYLRFHLSLPKAPGFAVMLDGLSGSGKTWFIDEFFKAYKERPLKLIHTSLYALETVEDLYASIHRHSGITDLMQRPQKSRSIDDFLDAVSHDHTHTYVLVIDDLEKSGLPSDLILGHLHAFISTEALRCILIADTTSLDKPFLKRLDQKIVGKRLEVQNDVSEVFDTFTQRLATDLARKITIDLKQKILSTYHLAGYGDLRHLFHTLSDLEFFLRHIPERFLVIQELMEELVTLFCLFSFELRQDTISADEIRQIDYLSMDKAYLEANEYGQDAMNHPMLRVAEKYALLDKMSLPPALWSELFSKGFVQKPRLVEALESSRYLLDDNSPAWRRLWHYQDLEEEEFDVILSIVQEQFEHYEFDLFGELLHVCGMFLHFSSLSLCSRSRTEVVEAFKAYIDSKRAKGEWGHSQKEFFEYELGDSWDRLDYYERQSSDFLEIREYLRRQLETSLSEALTQDAQRLIRVIIAHPEDFYRRSNTPGDEMRVSYDRPLFSTMDVEMFFKVFLALRNKTKREIADVFAQRYLTPAHAATLISELPFLEAFAKRLLEASDEREGRLDGHLLKVIKERSIDVAIEQLNMVKGSV